MRARIFESLVEQLRIADFDIKKEAAWGIANASSSGTLDQIRYLVHNCGCLDPLGALLEQKDARMVAVALEAIENILDKGEEENEDQNPYALIVEELEIVKTIEDLQDHANQPISEKAGYIIGKFYDGSTDNESGDEDIQEESDGSAYVFNAGPQPQQFSFS
jgi:importin subunit alpha-6/7